MLIGSGLQTRDIVANPQILSVLRLDPTRQLIGAQGSGTLLLARLGLLGAGQPPRAHRPRCACVTADQTARPPAAIAPTDPA